MQTGDSKQSVNRWTLWHVCASALLIVLILYNPFFGLTNHADGLVYQSLARHRATIGASELQHFTPVQEAKAQPEITVEEISPKTIAENEEYHSQSLQEIKPQRPELIASVWFRPPPTL